MIDCVIAYTPPVTQAMVVSRVVSEGLIVNLGKMPIKPSFKISYKNFLFMHNRMDNHKVRLCKNTYVQPTIHSVLFVSVQSFAWSLLCYKIVRWLRFVCNRSIHPDSLINMFLDLIDIICSTMLNSEYFEKNNYYLFHSVSLQCSFQA